MAESLETPPTAVRRVSPTTTNWERDQQAWNLPRRAPVVAYGDYKRSVRVSEERATEVATNAEAPSIEVTPVEAWENEGGASLRVEVDR